MATRRDQLMKGFLAKRGGAFGPIGGSAGDRIKGSKITEDDPRWNPKTMGNKRYREKGFVRSARKQKTR
jgi:hypothetical protein